MISIITPFYNSMKTIERAVNSIQKQTINDWELILIDDSSTDSSSLLIDKFLKTDKRIRYFKNQTNLGAGGSRNIGISHSNFDLIAFLDADDYWHEKKLETYLSYIKKYPQVSLFCSSYDIEMHGSVKKFKVKQEDLSLRCLLTENKIGLSTVLLNKKNIDRNYLKFSELRRRQDYLLWLTLVKSGHKSIAIPDYLTTYSVQKDSLSSNKLYLLKYNYKVLSQVLESRVASLYYLARQVLRSIQKYKFSKLKWSGAQKLGVIK